MNAYTQHTTDGKVYLVTFEKDRTNGTTTLIYDPKTVLEEHGFNQANNQVNKRA